MVSTVGYLPQQAIANPLQPKGDDLQKQQLARSGQDAGATSQNPTTGPQAQPIGAPAAQGEGSRNNTDRDPTQLSGNEFRAQQSLDEGRTPPRGSFVDLSV